MAVSKPLPTRKQLKVLRFIHEQSRTGVSPSFDEIRERFGVSSTNTVRGFVRTLEDKGCVARGEHGRARSLRVTDAGKKLLGVEKCHLCGSEVSA